MLASDQRLEGCRPSGALETKVSASQGLAPLATRPRPYRGFGLNLLWLPGARAPGYTTPPLPGLRIESPLASSGLRPWLHDLALPGRTKAKRPIVLARKAPDHKPLTWDHGQTLALHLELRVDGVVVGGGTGFAGRTAR